MARRIAGLSVLLVRVFGPCLRFSSYYFIVIPVFPIFGGRDVGRSAVPGVFLPGTLEGSLLIVRNREFRASFPLLRSSVTPLPHHGK